jgi:translation elongation factor EF-Ts
VIVCFVEFDGIVDHHCLSFLFKFNFTIDTSDSVASLLAATHYQANSNRSSICLTVICGKLMKNTSAMSLLSRFFLGDEKSNIALSATDINITVLPV